jgi:hypothetical protein
MPESSFTRPTHRQVHAMLSRLDSEFLVRTRCFFGGGTRIVLELGEYRESRDVDFLCSYLRVRSQYLLILEESVL